ncbi:phosphonopyruvate hydrolase [Sphingomonas sp. DT-204]|uniref:phosphonopyruvate hydrolase n=1 Tax=Sphingomonas sp. DT-204 TaxID=3396166 RepID=UPI003F1BFE4B
MSGASRLRMKLGQAKLLHVMAAHSPLSAKLAEEAGFDGLWASGFELSALFGLPDVSLISMSDHLSMVRAMAEHTTIPIIADIDTGFGNAVNVDHAVRHYERAGAAAVVIEDKTFPKVTSLVAGGRQELLPVSEFQGKIEAACAARSREGIVVIARTEALIAGLGIGEALRRGRAYEEAGAELLVVHSKATTPAEVLEFVEAWSGSIPVVLIPTAYPELTGAMMERLGKVAICIYGNHAIRAAVTGMKAVFAQIRKDGGIQNLADAIVPVSEIFRLQNMEHVKAVEERYLR